MKARNEPFPSALGRNLEQDEVWTFVRGTKKKKKKKGTGKKRKKVIGTLRLFLLLGSAFKINRTQDHR